MVWITEIVSSLITEIVSSLIILITVYFIFLGLDLSKKFQVILEKII